MNKYREPWDQSNYKFTGNRDYYYRDCMKGLSFKTPNPKDEPIMHKIIGSISFIAILILLMLV
jgi:hypothetical protein